MRGAQTRVQTSLRPRKRHADRPAWGAGPAHNALLMPSPDDRSGDWPWHAEQRLAPTPFGGGGGIDLRLVSDDLWTTSDYPFVTDTPNDTPLRDAAVKDIGADCRCDSGSIACTDAPDDQPGILTTAVIKPHSQFIL
jgi:hypothetical protein